MAIEVTMDSNEQTSQRAKTLQKAVEDHEKVFTWKGFDEIPVDVRFRTMDSYRTISVELKEPADLASSVVSGHLAKQVIMLYEAQEPGFIVCLGSLQDVFDSVFARSKADRYKEFGIIKHFCATSYSSGYPVFFYDMQWAPFTLSAVEDYFTQPSICDYLRKDKSNGVQVAMLCMIPGIGATTAVELIDTYGSIRALMNVKEEELEQTKINGRKLGKKTAEIMKVFK
jgi:ERCC4-type nuclease